MGSFMARKVVSENPENRNYRFERKFLITRLDVDQVENLVRLNTLGFYQAFPDRHVNNIYFDTPDLSAFSENVEGNSERIKARIRWYGEQFGKITNPVLEFKIRRNLVGTKDFQPLPDFELATDFTADHINRHLASAEIADLFRERMAPLSPILLNRYHRRYFVSSNRKIRLTLDCKLECGSIGRLWNNLSFLPYRSNAVVLELKYGQEESDEAQIAANQFPFRMTKSSKYVNAVFQTCP